MDSTEVMEIVKSVFKGIAVLAAVAVVLGLFYAVYAMFTDTGDDITGQLNSAAESIYSEYDNKVVSGESVYKALQNYRGRDIAVLIEDGSGASINLVNPDITTVNASVYNYCAMLSGFTANTAGNIAYDADAGVIVAPDGLDYTTGAVVYNNNFSPVSNKAGGATTTFVKQKGKYYATLVYSGVDDAICGILFLRTN